MRLISFAYTKEQFRNRTKDVTRRNAWWTLKPHTKLCGVEKAMGLRKGEKIVRLGIIEVIATSNEPLNHITQEEVVREGFPDWTPQQFIDFYCKAAKCEPYFHVRRIEYRYLDEEIL